MNIRPLYVWLSCSFLALVGAPVLIGQEPAAKAPEVPVARPVLREVTEYEHFAGRTEAPTRIDLRARVTGYLLKATFREGAEVKEGDVLFEIDQRLCRAELDKAEAAIGLAEARLKLAEATHKRAKALLAQKSIGQEELDKVVAEQAEAQAGIHLAKASGELARLNFDFTRVRAPISGRIGRRLLDPGNLVKADETILATVITRDPIYVYFDIDERTVLRLRRLQREAKKAEQLPVAIGLAGEEGYPHRGEVDFADNRLDPDTGTLRMRAVLANKDGLLDAGMLARVRLALGLPYKVLLVPSEALLAEDGARFVFVVNDKGVIEKRPVLLGQEHEGRRVVTRGLKSEDRVVVGRLQGLRPGLAVRPVEGDAAAPRPAPSPGESRPAGTRRERGELGPVVRVEAVYPGASAAIVAERVAAPIERGVQGVEKLLYLRSRSTNDGKYTLDVAFARGADPKLSMVLVQNRITLATPVLPDAVTSPGVKLREHAPGVLMIVTLSSPDNSRDALYLSNYASIQIKDELARLPGVREITLVGERDHSLRVWLDPKKLAARDLSAAEVVQAITKEKPAAAPGRAARKPGGKEREFEFVIQPLDRLADLDKLPELIVKTDGERRLVRLRDVGRIELDLGGESDASLDGKPAAVLVVNPSPQDRPRQLSNALREKVAQMRSRLPQGIELGLTFDFIANVETPDRPTTPEYLLLDPEMPVGASAERTLKTLRRCNALLHQLPGVEHVLCLTENPFEVFGSGPCILVGLGAADKRNASRAEITKAIRNRLDEIKEMTLRLRDLSGAGRFPRCCYPIDLAIYGPEVKAVREFAQKLAARLGESGNLTDVGLDTVSTLRPQLHVDVDRDAAAARDVRLDDVFNTLEVYLGSAYVNDFTAFGRTWRVEVQADAGSGDRANVIRELKVRNSRGHMIPLDTLAKMRETVGPVALDLLDSRPMVSITANPESGVPLDEVRGLCEKLAEEVRKELRLEAAYGLTWLR
jgi:RND family efflux transporter MFP subunit